LNIDFATISPGQELDCRHEAKQFVWARGIILELSRPGGLAAADQLPTTALLRDLQQELRTGLQLLQEGLHGWKVPPIKGEVVRADKRLVRGYLGGSFRDYFVDTMQRLVEASWSRIRVCPQCRKYFLKSGKQAYCSPSCSQKARWARFTAKRPLRNYRREREHALQKRLGPKVSLQQRRG
jgi:hypothetical protein